MVIQSYRPGDTKKMNKIFIVAGNAKQANAWAAEGHLHKDNYVVVNSVNDLTNYNILVAYVGTYYSRRDLHEIRHRIEHVNGEPTTRFKPTVS